MTPQVYEHDIPDDLDGLRADQAAAQLFSDFSRSRLKEWMKEGLLTVDGATVAPKMKITSGALMRLEVVLEPEGEWEAQDIPLTIVYEDDALLVVNKPAGLVVHPAAGNSDGTMLNALLHHHPAVRQIPRCGIVHRLDKETTGLLVVAKTLESHTALVKALQKREFDREYEAIVAGTMTGGGTINAPMGRHPRHRTKMGVLTRGTDGSHGGKEAVTHYRLLKRFTHHTHLQVKLETGRTHQIRVHMAHIHHPIVGDSLYAGREKIPKECSTQLLETLRSFPRQALHARFLGLNHPVTGEWFEWEAPLPEDFEHLLRVIAEEEARYE